MSNHFCNCKVCDKTFTYGDAQSPVLTDERWYDVLDYYGLWRYAAAAFKRYCSYQAGRHINSRLKDSPNNHCYICYECMEKALGRKLTFNDLEPVEFNHNFIRYNLQRGDSQNGNQQQ